MAKSKKMLYEYDLNKCPVTKALATFGMMQRLNTDIFGVIKDYGIKSDELKDADDRMIETAYFIQNCFEREYITHDILTAYMLVMSREELFDDLKRRFVKAIKKDYEHRKNAARAMKQRYKEDLGGICIESAAAFLNVKLSADVVLSIMCGLVCSIDLMDKYVTKGYTGEMAWAGVPDDLINGNGFTEIVTEYVKKYFENIELNEEPQYTMKKHSDIMITREFCMSFGGFSESVIAEQATLNEAKKDAYKRTFVVDPEWISKLCHRVLSSNVERVYKVMDSLGKTDVLKAEKRDVKKNIWSVNLNGECITILNGAVRCIMNAQYEYELKELRSKETQSDNEILKLKREVQRKANKLEQSRSETRKLKEKCDGLTSDIKKAQKHKDEFSSEAKESYISEIDTLNKKVFSLEREKSICENRNSELEAQNKELEDKIDELNILMELYEEEHKQLKDDNNKQEFDIDEHMTEIAGYIGSRRVFVLGSTDKWRESVCNYFSNYIERSKDNMSVDEIGVNDIMLLSIKNMKHCISKPVIEKCRKLGIKYIVLSETNLKHVMERLYIELLAEAGLGQGHYYGR